MFALLRQRNFALLWTGGLVSLAGDWVLYAALPFVVYDRTGSTVATAGMIVAELAPGALLGSVAGVFVDRRPRKQVLVYGSLVQGVAVGLLLLVGRGAGLWLVYAAAAIVATAAAFTAPAEGALLPSLVGPEELLVANALAALNTRLARVAGLAAGGALLGALGLDAVVVVDAVSFFAAALLIAGVAAPAAARKAGPLPGFAREWGEGLRLVRRDHTVGVLFGVLGAMTFGGTMLDPLTAPWVRDVLHRGPAVFAWLMAVHGAAGIAGSLLVGRFQARLAPRTLMGWGSIVAAAMLAVRFNVPVVELTFVLAAAGGVTSVASSVGAQTLIQQSVRDEYRGRVLGALGASGALLSLAGAAVGGILGEAIGIVPALDVATALVGLSGVVVLCAFTPRRRAAGNVARPPAGAA